MGKLCFGVDLGGTTVKMGVFTVEGSLLSDWEIPTRKEEKGKYIFKGNDYQLYDFLSTEINRLKNIGEVYYSDKLKEKKIKFE